MLTDAGRRAKRDRHSDVSGGAADANGTHASGVLTQET